MEVIILKDYDAVSLKAAQIMIDQVKNQPESILGLATGSTPVKMYEIMREDYAKNHTDYSKIKTYNLDEYYGLMPDHPQSYAYFMNKHLFSGVNIDLEHTHVPHGYGGRDEACALYNARLDNNPRDIQVLGIGSNGHIGFNEPGCDFESRTHCIDLKPSTIKDNAELFFDGDIDAVPKQAITMGIKDILASKKILLLAMGERKADAVRAMIEDPISNEVPATILRNHPDVTVIIDEAAASKLSR